MSEIMLVRQSPVEPTAAQKEAAREVLFGIVDGLGEEGRRRWRRFVNGLMRMQPGAVVEIRTRTPRSTGFHKRHMLIETALFEAQDTFEQFASFRQWLKLGAEFVDLLPGLDGELVAVPKSISFGSLEEDDMRELHERMVDFIYKPRAGAVLWPHLSPVARFDMVAAILGRFGE